MRLICDKVKRYYDNSQPGTVQILWKVTIFDSTLVLLLTNRLQTRIFYMYIRMAAMPSLLNNNIVRQSCLPFPHDSVDLQEYLLKPRLIYSCMGPFKKYVTLKIPPNLGIERGKNGDSDWQLSIYFFKNCTLQQTLPPP